MQIVECRIRCVSCRALVSFFLLILGACLTVDSTQAQSCAPGTMFCPTSAAPAQKAAPGRTRTVRAKALAASVTSSTAAAVGCSPVGTWSSPNDFGGGGVFRIGKDLSGWRRHAGCYHHSVITITGPNSFRDNTSPSYTYSIYGPPCEGAISNLTFEASCNKANGTYTNDDGSSGIAVLIRRDTPKNLGDACEGTNALSGQPGQVCGDPINVTTGNVVETVTDFAAASDSPLAFRRYYNSFGSSGALLRNWTSNFDAKVMLVTNTMLVVVRGSQKELTFNWVEGEWYGDADVTARLTEITTGWRYFNGADSIETYDASGRLASIVNSSGRTQQLTYDAAGLLSAVSDTFGRQLSFGYDTSKRLVNMTEPSGGNYVYSYDGIGNLAWVVQPGGGALNYLYENPMFPHAMTGIVDENSKRFSTWTYDAAGLALTSEQPNGIGKITVTRDFPALDEITVTDSLSHSQKYTYFGANDVKHTATMDLTGSGFAQHSSWTYFENGNIASYTDFAGNLSCFGYDHSRNLETVRIEGLPYTADACPNLTLYPLPPNGRVTTTAWHPTWRLSVRVAQPKRLTSNVYNGQPDPVGGGAALNCAPAAATLPDGSPIAVLCKRIEQATTDTTGGQGLAPTLDTTSAARTWSYTYNQYGQVLTATDPRGNTSTFAYYTATTADRRIGDLQSVTNAVGHVTQFTKYDLAGRLLRSVGPTGATTDAVYTPRGWVSSITVTPSGGGTAQVMSWTYDLAGQRKVATLPDGTTIQYGYDDAHRLTSITDGAGNSVIYTLDSVGNRIGEQRKDPGGTLTRNITRAFDGLNQLKSVTGAAQ
jgi:YD repeat-containing protein